MNIEAIKNKTTGIKEQMKNIETNLQVMAKCRRKCDLNGPKSKTEVEHQLKSELEKSVQECMVHGMNNMEDRMENNMEERMKTMES